MIASRSPHSTTPGARTYVLDTSVLLSDPQAIFRFAEHAVVIPVVVIGELEGKRNDPEIGYFARKALRNLDDLRVAHERLDFTVDPPQGHSRSIHVLAEEKEPQPGGVGYSEWAGQVVRDEIHKAGWRLAEVMKRCVQ